MDINSLDRFVKAQKNTYQTALTEIKNGKKRTHWMWFIFPQLRGLGRSEMAYAYGINGLKEAREYLNDPRLSAALREICLALLEHKGKTAYEIFGEVDAMKLRSSMTLFALAGEGETVFDQVLAQFFGGKYDETTVKLLNKQ